MGGGVMRMTRKLSSTKREELYDITAMFRYARAWIRRARWRLTPVQRYVISHNHEWAIIYIDEKHGAFCCQSTFGTYAYIWRSIGTRTLKEFLRDLNFDYFMEKTRPGYRTFDEEVTRRAIKDHILSARREDSIDAETARRAWRDIEDIAEQNDIRFIDEVARSHALIETLGGGYYEFARERPDADSRGFWKVIWPQFLEQIGGAR